LVSGFRLRFPQALGYDVHPDEYHSYVHGRLPYDRIAADPHLARLLQSIPQRKVLFTNSDRAHMKRALERLGVDESVFDAVVCFETMNPHLFGEEGRRAAAGSDPRAVVLKPAVDAIVAGLRAAGTNPRRTVTTPNCRSRGNFARFFSHAFHDHPSHSWMAPPNVNAIEFVNVT